MTPLTKFWATISQEIEPEISCGLLEKEACQLIEIDKPLFREELHERQSSISCEKVGLSFVRGVISEAHVPGNDEILFYSVVCGRRNSLQEGFFDKMGPPHRAD